MLNDTERSDNELIQDFLNGKEDSFRFLVERYQKSLLNYIFRLTNNIDLAEELVQETFMTVFQNLSKFERKSTFKTWMYAIATNRTLNAIRKKSPILNGDAFSETVSQKTPGPLSNLKEQERAQAVQQALESLPEKHRAVFLLRFYEKLSYEEISVALGCPLGTVKSRMAYSMEKLRGILWNYRNRED